MILSLLARILPRGMSRSAEPSPLLDATLPREPEVVVGRSKGDNLKTISLPLDLINEMAILRPSGVTFELSGKVISPVAEPGHLFFKALQNLKILDTLAGVSKIAHEKGFHFISTIDTDKVISAAERVEKMRGRGFGMSFDEKGISVDLTGKETKDIYLAFNDLTALRTIARANRFTLSPTPNTMSDALKNALEKTATLDGVLFTALVP